jgi:hypothetical protein
VQVSDTKIDVSQKGKEQDLCGVTVSSVVHYELCGAILLHRYPQVRNFTPASTVTYR